MRALGVGAFRLRARGGPGPRLGVFGTFGMGPRLGFRTGFGARFGLCAGFGGRVVASDVPRARARAGTLGDRADGEEHREDPR